MTTNNKFTLVKRHMISVCIATYNGERHIKEQLDSILSQLSLSDEIIVSDDGSTDQTLNIINNYNDSRIAIYHHTKKKERFSFGYTASNFENAISKSKGDVIFLADQDDVWIDNKIERCINYLKNGYDLILHDCAIVDQNNNLIDKSYFKLNNSTPGIFNNIVKNSYLGCCMAINKKVLDYALPFPKDIPHDIWIGLIAEQFTKVKFLQEILINYRRHGNNLSASGEKSSNTLLFKIKYRAIILREFINRSLQLKIHNR